MAACALVHETSVVAVGLQIQTAPATPTPSIGVLVAQSVLHHQLHLYELAGLHQAIGSRFLLPGNLGKPRSIRPRRNVAGIRRLYSEFIGEGESQYGEG